MRKTTDFQFILQDHQTWRDLSTAATMAFMEGDVASTEAAKLSWQQIAARFWEQAVRDSEAGEGQNRAKLCRTKTWLGFGSNI